MRTSITHPLLIDDLAVANGRLGLTFCPGKKGGSLFGDSWDRDLDTDLDAVREWRATVVVTLVEAAELSLLQVEGLGEGIQRRGMDWLHLPILDLEAPDALWMSLWEPVSRRLHAALEAGGRVLVHCRGGLGRAGTVAALLLIERGEDAGQAIARVRAVRPGAIETAAQWDFLNARAALTDRKAQLIRASLFGGAMGDALGAEIEFWSLDRIRTTFPRGLMQLPVAYGLRGAITDDTQMTLFTAEGLIRAQARSIAKGICHPPGVVHHALLRWYQTQGCKPKVAGLCRTGLVADPRLHKRRAPGNTCLSALSVAESFGQLARNSSKGCGTIMRVAPVGLLGFQVRELALGASALTHGHETGQEAAAAFACILAEVLEGVPLERAIHRALAVATGGTAAAMNAALCLPRDGRPETVERLGGGWVAEEALAIALYAALAAPGFEAGLRIAVTHSGDSDSTGAIAGNLLGLLHPEEVMQHPWREQVECADLIDRIARDLARSRAPEAEFVEQMWERYPGW